MLMKIKKVFFCCLSATAFLSATPKAVIFDHGGVLTMGDPDQEKVISFLSKNFNVTNDMILDFKESNLQKKKVSKPDLEFWSEYAKQSGVKPKDGWEEDFDKSFQDPMGVNLKMYALVNTLKEKGVTVGLLSNCNTLAAKLMKKTGLTAPFNPCLFSNELGVEKPDSKVFEILLAKLDLPASEVVFIDDQQRHVDAAKAMGIDAILFESHSQITNELSKRGVI